ncbi:MAG: hypothetical protein DMC62_09290 [Verrucomicrobia bacterium]|nr:MAG: hypothetical protein DMC62_09290 [Verrucomicrobiota bacterium]
MAFREDHKSDRFHRLHNTIMTIQMFFQSSVILKPGEEFATYQQELTSLCPQRLKLLDRFAAIDKIPHLETLHQDMDHTV